MPVPISRFRKDIFSFADAALQGQLIEFVHKGITFRLVPSTAADKLNNITPIQVVTPGQDLEGASRDLRDEMERDWEKDWKSL